jgi:hypothetical protein
MNYFVLIIWVSVALPLWIIAYFLCQTKKSIDRYTDIYQGVWKDIDDEEDEADWWKKA